MIDKRGLSKIGIFVLIGVVICLLPFVASKNFIIRNQSDSSQIYFIVNGTTGGVEVPGGLDSGNFTIGGDLNVSGNLNLGNGTILYNSTDNKYYYYNTSTWLVFDVEREQNATLMGLHNPDYDSGWVEVTASETVLNHNLNTESTLVTLERNETSLELRNLSSMVLLMPMNGTDGYNTDGASDVLGRHTFDFEGNAHINTSTSKFGGSAFKSDGVGDSLNFSDSSDWDFGSGDFTIEFWWKTSYSGVSDNLAFQHYTTNVGYFFRRDGGGGMDLRINDVYYFDTTDADVDFTNNTWNHWTIIREGNILYLYKDGILRDKDDFSGTIGNPSTEFNIFGGTQSGDHYIDELAIYKGRALSSDEVMSHFERHQHVYLAEKNSSSIKLVADDFKNQVCVKMWKEGVIEGNFSGNLVATGNFSLSSKITFALGEIIENVVSGWTKLTNNLNVTGNMSLGGKMLWNNNGTLTWGDKNIESTNVSVMYGTNSSGAQNPLKTTDSGVLKLSVTSLKTDVWDSSTGVTSLTAGDAVNISGDLNVTGSIIGAANGVGIDSDVSTDDNYVLTSADRNRLVILNSSAGGHTNFTLPAGTNGEIYRVLNDAEYLLTIKPSGSDIIWNSGSGYGIDLPDKGTMVELRYSSSRGKWDILQKTGGKVLIEGLVLMEPINRISMYTEGSTEARFPDRTEKHMADMVNDVQLSTTSGKFAPAYFDFPGNNEFFYYEDSTDWDIFGTNTTGHKTIGFWVYFDDSGVDDTMIDHYVDLNNYWRLHHDTSNLLQLYVVVGGSELISLTAGSLPTSTWTHIALVVNGTEIGTYINGTQVAYDGSWNTVDLTGALFVGSLGGAYNYLNGKMQDLHISYNNPYNANPNSGSTDSFTLPAAPFRGVME